MDLMDQVRAKLRQAAEMPSASNEWLEENADMLVRSAAAKLANKRYTWLRLLAILAVGVFLGALLCSVVGAL